MARTGEKINSYTVLRGNLKERDHLEDFSVDGSIQLKWRVFRMV